jgi:hypothetical protein
MTAWTSGNMVMPIAYTRPSGVTTTGNQVGMIFGVSGSTSAIASVNQWNGFMITIRAKNATNVVFSTTALTTGTYDISVKVFLIGTT